MSSPRDLFLMEHAVTMWGGRQSLSRLSSGREPSPSTVGHSNTRRVRGAHGQEPDALLQGYSEACPQCGWPVGKGTRCLCRSPRVEGWCMSLLVSFCVVASTLPGMKVVV